MRGPARKPWKRRVLLVAALTPGAVAFAAGDWLMERSLWWGIALLAVVPLVLVAGKPDKEEDDSASATERPRPPDR